MTQHLWDPEHDYYGPESNWFATGAQQSGYSNTWESWGEFADGWGQPIDGLNWLYRFDWIKPSAEDVETFPDEDHRDYVRLFYLLPRKGILLDHTVYVTEADEAAVRAFLEPAAEYTRRMWAPFMEGATA
ncbi:hypothetical protein [Curtobacterium sp. MCBD17_021]|uniref:hypothetical protein n=1 Tax=Curtobacterium sp. MCBD17_021 TaxID=2175665 RepID=UPI000DA87013|nr:hypothetical protein [Curtobacterium sp. MCBD17_021]PZE66934.1 hypothetical protein DEI83_06390 [Curtobacterium sp. MCBD17_021]